MGRRNWVVGGAVLGLVLVTSYVGATLAALFPAERFVYSPPSGLIGLDDFERVAVEVQAIEESLGVNLGNIVKTRAPCIPFLQPVAGERVDTVWRAPESGRIVGVSCDTSGVNSLVTVDLQTDDGSPASIGSPIQCGNVMAPLVAPSGGQMAEGDRLDLVINTVIGSATRVSVCFIFQPEA